MSNSYSKKLAKAVSCYCNDDTNEATQGHTPGDWFTFEGENTGALCVGTENGTICVMDNAPLQGVYAKPNARLIAAAPELLAACRLIVRSVSLYRPTDDSLDTCYLVAGHAIDDIQEVIAKAEGRS
jgi:hypothetical protein